MKPKRHAKQLAAGSGVRIYRRHSIDCPYKKNNSHLKCDCAVWIQFQRGGKQIRESAKTRDLETALALVKRVEKELSGEVSEPKKAGLTVREAIELWKTSRAQDGFKNTKSDFMGGKLVRFCDERGITLLSEITKADLSTFKGTLPFKSKNSNSLRAHVAVVGGLFSWATEAGHLTANPFPDFKLKFEPLVLDPSDLPTAAQIAKVLSVEKTRLIASLQRHSGMAIVDAVMLKRSALNGITITSKRHKTHKPFRVNIPLDLANELRAQPFKEYFFHDGTMQPMSLTGNYRKALWETCEQVGVEMRTHTFRHFFITERLAMGVVPEDVSLMVGTSANEIRKTYRHFVQEHNDRLDDVQRKVWAKMGLDANGNSLS
jgi:integrase